jgi:hypothetical protein
MLSYQCDYVYDSYPFGMCIFHYSGYLVNYTSSLS